MKEIITEAVKRRKKLIEGNVALIVVDIQGGSMKLLEEHGLTGLVIEKLGGFRP